MTFRNEQTTSLPLDGLMVLDLTMNIAGPYATMILGDLGATVVKVERPAGGDDSRRMMPRHAGASAYFYAINRNKTSVTLDLTSPHGKEEMERLLGDSDVFVTNLRPTALDKYDLCGPSLLNRHPRLICAYLSAYGEVGPERARPGYDMVLQARSGLMSVNGEPNRNPVRVGVSILDMGSGTWLALAVLAALTRRARTGKGEVVSTSLLEVGAALMAYDIAVYELTGQQLGPRGSGHPSFGPYGVFETGDGLLAIGVGADHLFKRLAVAVGAPQWADDSRFAHNDARMRNLEVLRSLLEAQLATRSAKEWTKVLTVAGVPADIVATVADVVADPQLDYLGAWLDTPLLPTTQRIRLPGLPIRFSGERPPLRLPPPTRLPETQDVLSADHAVGGRGEGSSA